MGWLSKLFTGREKVQPVHLTDDNFHEEVMRSDVPVMIDFWSPSCGPCAKLAPIVVDLATEFEGRIKVAEANVAEAPRVAGRWGVRGTPTVLYVHKGQVIERVVGFRGSLYHREIIENELLDGEADASAPAEATGGA